MNRDVARMSKAQMKAWKARHRRFHLPPEGTVIGTVVDAGALFNLARAMAFVADAIDGGPHA